MMDQPRKSKAQSPGEVLSEMTRMQGRAAFKKLFADLIKIWGDRPNNPDWKAKYTEGPIDYSQTFTVRRSGYTPRKQPRYPFYIKITIAFFLIATMIKVMGELL